MSRGVSQRGGGRVQFNLTPMIDMTFLLIVFFILTTQITNIEVAEEIELVEPEHAVSVEPAEEERIIINLIPEDADRSRVRRLRMGFTEYEPTPEGLAALAGELRAAVSRDPKVSVDVRADRLAAYSEVFPVLRTAARTGVRQVKLVVAETMEAGGVP